MKVKELLSDKSKWAEGRMAYTKYNKAAYTFDDVNDDYMFVINKDTACRFCLMGAIAMCYNDGVVDERSTSPMRPILDRIEARTGQHTALFNDSGVGYEAVKALVQELDI